MLAKCLPSEPRGQGVEESEVLIPMKACWKELKNQVPSFLLSGIHMHLLSSVDDRVDP